MAIKPDIEACIEHNYMTAGAERMASTRRAYDEVIAAGRSLGHPFSGFEINFRARAAVSYYRDNDLAALKKNAFAPKPVQLLNDLINHSTDQVLNQDAEGK